jgi:pimeloyl-ACP methyl ester carboxylesterase
VVGWVHGGSVRPSRVRPLIDPEAPNRHCDDLAALVAALDLGTVVIGGNSFGATVALDTVLTHPSIVAGLILAPLAPLPGWSWVDGFPLAPALKLAGSASTEEVVEAILALPMNEPARSKPEVVAVLSEMALPYSGWHFTHRDPGRSGTPDALDRLGDVTVPALIVTGDRDVADVQMIADAVAAGVSNGRRVALAGVGHSPKLEDPASFDLVSLEFLARAMA